MCVGILLDCQIKGIKHKLVIVVHANCKGNNVSAFQVQNCAEIGLFILRAILHLRNIRTSLLIFDFGMVYVLSTSPQPMIPRI